jgi:hypothetical protein
MCGAGEVPEPAVLGRSIVLALCSSLPWLPGEGFQPFLWFTGTVEAFSAGWVSR